jgi:hypothetical protein
LAFGSKSGEEALQLDKVASSPGIADLPKLPLAQYKIADWNSFSPIVLDVHHGNDLCIARPARAHPSFPATGIRSLSLREEPIANAAVGIVAVNAMPRRWNMAFYADRTSAIPRYQ